MKRLPFLHIALIKVSVGVLLLILVVLPVAADNHTPYMPLFSVAAGDCTSGFTFNGAVVNPYARILHFRYLVDSGGLRYTDQVTNGNTPYPALVMSGVLVIGTTNEGGTANASWPIPTGQPVDVTVVIMDENFYQISESRITLSACNGTVTATTAGAVGHLVSNIGFETAGSSPLLPAKWDAKVDNDQRLCNGDVPGAAHTGDCAFNMKPGPAAKNKLSQKSALEVIALNGDQIRFGAWVKAGNLGTGSSIMIKIKFPTLPKIKQKIDLPAGTYDYQFISTDAIDITEAPNKLIVAIQAKGSGGSFVIDDVQAQVAAGVNPPPTTLTSGVIPLPGGVPQTTGSSVDLVRPGQ